MGDSGGFWESPILVGDVVERYLFVRVTGMYKWLKQIKELTIIRPEQLWVSDITNIRPEKRSCFSLASNAYSGQMTGYSFRGRCRFMDIRKAYKWPSLTYIFSKPGSWFNEVIDTYNHH